MRSNEAAVRDSFNLQHVVILFDEQISTTSFNLHLMKPFHRYRRLVPQHTTAQTHYHLVHRLASSNSLIFPQVFRVFLTDALIFLNHQTYTNWHYLQSISCTSTFLTVLKLGYAYFVTIATAVAHHKQTTISMTFPRLFLISLTFP